MKAILAAIAATAALFIGVAHADGLTDSAKAGKPIRIGFAHEIPWAYPGDKNEPLGFANALAVGVLKSMGYTNIEPVVTDWGGLIPGLQAGRFDIITGGMYITGKRCKNVAFAEPMGKFGNAFIVKKGNPKGIQNYKDIKEKDATMVTVSGYVNVDEALKEGVPESKIMQVPGPTELLAAVRAGRADAGASNYFDAKNLAASAPDEIEVTDPAALPDWTNNWVAIAFKPEDKDFLKAYNEAQAKYLGSPEMLEAVGKFQYTKAQLPGDAKTDWICANR
ncbi:ectoine/hydroxyectoine ABC transporter substrate-binding protein EhuB [Mesorhizobium sp. NZP2077]|uniref:ectoine/hydroxyectoine ABC transporter substrate-binding protein EhuB n=1 Tax=Mesorhizobium sp. NZP2077 TaxID=2483404 RepID=UPI0015545EC9|nr:ectoine/hydroxyectoine ABC transporter substrate-binding protein EhuB [Mesorhizobium sp. NZP2077]QKC86954.1 ectoine/hydroxyectoine ABC transporter substrate-binding protein EhuB [Mesorhizobium sp. NZP2077]QKD20420.1 ectoine/hydroxyectoine ABC transporter substrate-binding protein EhuB [Mesorhizobium sp. NZP2077]